jgi:hypothetical protein
MYEREGNFRENEGEEQMCIIVPMKIVIVIVVNN